MRWIARLGLFRRVRRCARAIARLSGKGLCSAWRGSEAIRCLSAFRRVLVSASCQPSYFTVPANHLYHCSIWIQIVYGRNFSTYPQKTLKSWNCFLFGSNLRYDFCIIETMFEKAMFLGGLVTVSTETSFNAIFQWCVLSMYNTRQWTSLRILSTPYVYVHYSRSVKCSTSNQPLVFARVSLCL